MFVKNRIKKNNTKNINKNLLLEPKLRDESKIDNKLAALFIFMRMKRKIKGQMAWACFLLGLANVFGTSLLAIEIF